MSNYIDGFVLPIPLKHLNEYANTAKQVAQVWKEHGALAYFEYVSDDMHLEGARSFPEFVEAKEDEAIVFGWVVFESKEARDLANKKVPLDPRMKDLINPLIEPDRLIFDFKRMVYAGFRSLI